MRGYVPSAVISDSLFLIEFNGKKGISDAEGSIVLEPEYDGITNLSKDNIILIRMKNLVILILPQKNNFSKIFQCNSANRRQLF